MFSNTCIVIFNIHVAILKIMYIVIIVLELSVDKPYKRYYYLVFWSEYTFNLHCCYTLHQLSKLKVNLKQINLMFASTNSALGLHLSPGVGFLKARHNNKSSKRGRRCPVFLVPLVHFHAWCKAMIHGTLV